MRLVVIFILVASILVTACKKERIGEDEYATFYYKQTYCADPWPTGATDSITLVNVSNYLSAAGIYVAGLQIKLDSPQELCLACACKTGKTIYVTTLNSVGLAAKYIGLGFKR